MGELLLRSRRRGDPYLTVKKGEGNRGVEAEAKAPTRRVGGASRKDLKKKIDMIQGTEAHAG